MKIQYIKIRIILFENIYLFFFWGGGELDWKIYFGKYGSTKLSYNYYNQKTYTGAKHFIFTKGQFFFTIKLI